MGDSYRQKRLDLARAPPGPADRYKVQVRSRPSRLQGIGQDEVVGHGLDGWTQKRAPDGATYYHHDVIGTQYDRPIGFDLETGGGSGMPSTVPLALLTPNSRRAQLKKILSWQKYQQDAEMSMNMGNVPAMPEDTGTFCEHVMTCRCDWLDWSCLCSMISVFVGSILFLIEIGAERTTTPNYTAGVLMVLIPVGLWALCVGVPYIAFNTTLGRSRW
jgi:hypothetical protein